MRKLWDNRSVKYLLRCFVLPVLKVDPKTYASILKIVILLLIAFGLYHGSSRLFKCLPDSKASTVSRSGSPASTTTSTTVTTGDPQVSPIPTQATEERKSTSDPAFSRRAKEQIEPGEKPDQRWFVGAILLFSVFSVGYVLKRLTMRPDRLLSDPDEFVQAINTWSALVESKAPTPRMVKWWINRARLLCYLSKPDTPGPTWREECIEKLERFTGVPVKPKEANRRPSQDARKDGKDLRYGIIPPKYIVAFCTIEFLNPEWLSEAEADIVEHGWVDADVKTYAESIKFICTKMGFKENDKQLWAYLSQYISLTKSAMLQRSESSSPGSSSKDSSAESSA